ncbi:MAG: helix-turn-helix transcriptional regulator [Phycisphaerales bacterium]|nr:helix-turn-helix transcriptional regulator [Phycisphaerales bacterium]
MNRSKQRRLEAAGWKVGSTAEFLELTPPEVAFIEMKVSLARHMRLWRVAQGLTQGEVAASVGSSQSRVAKMEAAHRDVSIDLLVRTLLALGVTRKGLAKMISARVPRSAA